MLLFAFHGFGIFNQKVSLILILKLQIILQNNTSNIIEERNNDNLNEDILDTVDQASASMDDHKNNAGMAKFTNLTYNIGSVQTNSADKV